MTESTEIARVRKNTSEQVVVSLAEFRGTELIDVRIHADYDSTGDLRPTKKGVTVKVSLLPELIAGLQLAEAEARRRGLLEREG